jgi:stage V sporulation protein B
MEERSVGSLRILAVVFPFCGVTACINGYYYGLKKAGVPASTQLLEQLVRVLIVYLFAMYAGKGDFTVTCELAVFGVVIGEVASSVYNLLSLVCTKSPKDMIPFEPDPNAQRLSTRVITRDIVHLSTPLSANRLFISILHSIEAVLIPNMLRKSGLSTSEALSIFGVLNGMTMPFIMFPTAVTNALAVLLLPTISEAQATNNNKLIGKTTTISVKYSLMIGILSTGIFVAFGNHLGNLIFHNQDAGTYLVIIAWLCPFIYLTTTFGSIINGLGKAHITFLNSVIGTCFKILLIVFMIPKYGITGYLIALLISQLLITSLDGYAVIKNTHFPFHAVNSIVKPGIIITLSSLFMKKTYEYIAKMTQFNEVIILLTFCFILCVIYLILLFITHGISKKDFK